MASLLRLFTSRSALLQGSHPLQQCNNLFHPRLFSTTPSYSLNAHPDTKKTPPYPYGFSRFYKQANRGLYGHVKVRTNARVVGKYPAQRTIRRWHPNVHRKRLYSPCLGRYIRVKVVIRVLRTIDKVGGIDNYLLGQSPGRIKELGPTGWALRWRLLRTEKGKEMWEEERQRLGLVGMGPRDEGWLDPVAAETERLQRDALLMAEEGVEGDESLSEEELVERERAIDDELEREDQLGDAGGFEIGGAEGERARPRHRS
jgi:large subunit ribosomal protein L28